LRAELTRQLYRRSEGVATYLERTFGIRYSISGVTSLLKRLGFSYKKTERQNPPINQEQAMHKELHDLQTLALHWKNAKVMYKVFCGGNFPCLQRHKSWML
jgi:hypothetical protein